MNPKQALFAREYLVDLNAKQAAIRAGYSPRSAEVTGHRLLSDAKVKAAITEGQQARARRVEITADMVLERLWSIASADPNELVQFRRGCCRYCYGEDHRFQRTQREVEAAIATWQAAKERGDDVAMYDVSGGTGWDPRRPPVADCPECFGEGAGEPYVADTTKLSPEARALYAGLKVTQHGLEVKLNDQAHALVQVGRHLGMFTDKLEVDTSQGLADRLEAARKRSRKDAA